MSDWDLNDQRLSQEQHRIAEMTPAEAMAEHKQNRAEINVDSISVDRASYWLRIQDMLYLRGLEELS